MNNLSYQDITITKDLLSQLDTKGLPFPLYTFVNITGNCYCCGKNTDGFYTCAYRSKYYSVEPVYRCCMNTDCINYVKLGALLVSYNENIFPDHNLKKAELVIPRSDGSTSLANSTLSPIFVNESSKVIDVTWLDKDCIMKKLVDLDLICKLNKTPKLEVYVPNVLLEFLKTNVWFLKNIRNNLSIFYPQLKTIKNIEN